ncbi:MAG: FAD-dependent thymidylate synthase, partial [Actinobacteria bacterium]|nr:FAD-dependent thymidylate synthase [Actinomycetota bacterium]
MLYAAERFTADEEAVLRRYFTNLDQPVFALVNLPEVVKGALFARYSRSPLSLRRLFLKEFVGELDMSGDETVDATIGLRRAEELYDKVFFEYGDDSVAQLGGVHLACEQASNLLTKILEWGRLMAYLEQSTRYIAYDQRLTNGRYRYYRDRAVLESGLGARYVGELDRMFDAYAEMVPALAQWFTQRYPKDPNDSDFVYRTSIKAKALDAARGMLPAASLSNVGIYGTGQGYEALLLRMRAHPLPEARAYADLMLTELRKVIPSFLKRVDVPDRGGAWSSYLEKTAAVMADEANALLSGVVPEERPMVTLVEFDPDGEDKVIAATLYAHSHLPEDQVLARVRRLGADEKRSLLLAYVGERTNRRHKPGRALERTGYRFDVLSDYGAFRDLQRHRMLTIEWQTLTADHGYTTPDAVADAGLEGPYVETMERSAALHDALKPGLPAQAPYAVALAYRVRYAMQFNAREAMHMLE